jgi:hypothetical protein
MNVKFQPGVVKRLASDVVLRWNMYYTQNPILLEILFIVDGFKYASGMWQL